jgi:mono/diheme cytochrome c family protein
MRYCIPVRAVLNAAWFAGCISFLISLPIRANPVPADEQSLTNGAEAYELYCAKCHGWGPVADTQDFYEFSEDEQPYDFSELLDEAEALRAAVESDESEDWPEWAELPDPGDKANDADVRAEIMAELTGAIDEAYGTAEVPLEPEFEASAFNTSESYHGEQPYSGEDGFDEDDSFGRLPGATDLTDPGSYYYGISEENLYDSIANGTGATMPGWSLELASEDSVWDLVNFIRSLWDEEWLY